MRDLGLLQSAVARPKAIFDGDELYPDVFSKAAALLDSLVNNHPFVDGNKRTGITSTGLFLRLNGWKIIASSEELEEFVMKVASSHLELSTMGEWILGRSEKE